MKMIPAIIFAIVAILTGCSTGGFIKDGQMTVMMPTDVANTNDYTNYSFKSPTGYQVEWSRHRADQTKILDTITTVYGLKAATKMAKSAGDNAVEITKEISE